MLTALGIVNGCNSPMLAIHQLHTTAKQPELQASSESRLAFFCREGRRQQHILWYVLHGSKSRAVLCAILTVDILPHVHLCHFQSGSQRRCSQVAPTPAKSCDGPSISSTRDEARHNGNDVALGTHGVERLVCGRKAAVEHQVGIAKVVAADQANLPGVKLLCGNSLPVGSVKRNHGIYPATSW